MKAKLLTGMLVAACFLPACQRSGVVKESDGITLSLKDSPVKKVRLQVISPEIIRVSATAQETFSTAKSLSVVDNGAIFNDWTFSASGDTAVVATSVVKAYVSQTTGEVWFTDSEGNTLLKENQGGGKTLEPMSVDGVNGYTLRQLFESPDDEAFYGLGQHQVNDMNYKGKNETLFQYNTKVSIPFLVSNKNYGLLWDNYSVTKFGDIRDYMPLSEINLYGTDSVAGGLTATYCLNGDPKNIFIQRQESNIDYENLETIKNFPEGYNFNRGLITWEGDMEAKESGIHRFQLYYAGYTKIWIDGQLLADKWRTAWNPSYERFNIHMEPGQKHHIKLEWFPDGGVSYVGLKLLTPVDPSEQNKLSLYSEMGDQIDYYFIYGEDMDEVIKGYRNITGKAQVMPKWAMGFWQSRERYKTQDELVSTLKEFRKRNIPIDNIVLDWSYWAEDQWGSHEFEASRFPDAKAMVDEVHNANAHIMISVWPKFYINTEHYKEFDEKGWMYKQAVNDSIRDWIGKGYIGSFYDAYNADARKLFWKQMEEHLLPAGFDAWWMDASEPDIQSNSSLNYRKALVNPTALGPSTKYFNAYALVNAQAIYEGQKAVLPDQRVFLLTRSGFTGMQRYGAATWSGDIGTCWEDFRSQISAGLNYSIAGNPYWTMDIGGFSVQKRFERAKEGSEDLNEWRELNARWTQFGAFAPLFRAHGQYPYREVFNIAPESHP
ncbi:MAG: glycoside hydrolase family 31 protein, partial [Bacteroidales bacterium]|nr:glycoside hydrolase family 31 protein [Bacteroidales bacterium]